MRDRDGRGLRAWMPLDEERKKDESERDADAAIMFRMHDGQTEIAPVVVAGQRQQV